MYHVTSLMYHVTSLMYHVTSLMYHVTSLMYHVTSLMYHVTSLMYHVTSLMYHVTFQSIAIHRKKSAHTNTPTSINTPAMAIAMYCWIRPDWTYLNESPVLPIPSATLSPKPLTT
jgi:hypothetical protein